MLESRQLMAAVLDTYLNPLPAHIPAKDASTSTIFTRLLGSLQAQINSGPLADLSDPKGNTAQPKIPPSQYVADIENMVDGFEEAGEFAEPNNPQLGNLVQLQGTALDAETITLAAQAAAGIIEGPAAAAKDSKVTVGTTSAYDMANVTTVEHLTLSRPLWPTGTPLLNYINRDETFEADLTTLATSIPKTLTIGAAAGLAQDEANVFTADVNLSTLKNKALGSDLDQQTNVLMTRIGSAISAGSSAVSDFTGAIADFTNATYSQKTGAGYLGPKGTYGKGKVQPTNGSQLPAGVALPAFSDANTFLNGQYKAERATQTIIYHRNYGGGVSQFGRYVTTTIFANPQAAIRGSALDQTFPSANNAFYTTDVQVPASVLRYVGKVAPIYQGILSPEDTLYPGLGPQILLSTSRSPVVFLNVRVTGT